MSYYQNKETHAQKSLLIKGLHLLFEEVPILVNKYESRDSDFTFAVKKWLSNGETLLTKNKRPEVSELASLRGTIIAADRGVIDPSFSIDIKLRKGKATRAVTLFSLHKGQSILRSVLDSLIDDAKEAETIIKQIIALAGQNGLLIEYFKNRKPGRQDLKSLWPFLAKTEDIRVGMNRILTLISFDDLVTFTETVLDGWPSFLLQAKTKESSGPNKS